MVSVLLVSVLIMAATARRERGDDFIPAATANVRREWDDDIDDETQSDVGSDANFDSDFGGRGGDRVADVRELDFSNSSNTSCPSFHHAHVFDLKDQGSI